MFDPIEVRDDATLSKKLECLFDGETVFTYRAYILKGPEIDERQKTLMKARLIEWGVKVRAVLDCEMVDSSFTEREPRIDDPAPLDTVLVYRIGLKRRRCCYK